MNADNILKELNLEHTDLDFQVNSISNLTKDASHCIMFCNKVPYKDIYKSVHDCIIFYNQEVFPDMKDFDLIVSNVIMRVVYNPKWYVNQCIEKLSITKVFGLEYLGNQLLTKFGVDTYVSPKSIVHNAIIGDNCHIHDNVIIGNDDFCPIESNNGDTLELYAQIGNVVIGNNVHIFPFSTVSRGTFQSTKIGDGTKIDHYCEVGHNCTVGKNVSLCAGVIMAGSSKVDDGTFVGVRSTIRSGVHVGKYCTIGQCSNVVKDVPDYAIVMGNPAKVVGYNDDKGWNYKV